MRIADVMSTEVATVAASETAGRARQTMNEKRFHHLVVVDGKRVVGVVSSRDLKGVSADAEIGEIMSAAPVTVEPEATIKRAANLLRGHLIGCLPVMENDKLRGILTISDLLGLIGQGIEKPVEQNKRWTLKHRGPRRVQERRAGGGR